MKKNIILSFLGSVLLFASSCASSNQVSYNYEIYCQGVGSQGSNLLKVYSYAGNMDKAALQAKHYAVHGVLFKGFAGGNGCNTQPPMVTPEEQNTHKAFFDNFFKGDYERFVYLSNDGSVSPKDRVKVGGQYKVGVIVSVNKNELRKYLESEGVIKKIGNIFN